ncbi:MAG: ABC transporter ATP-binding protein [Planctomycetes bacterium]|nr:ABC transporter ATP-binding protein [Planctomycetota bacterium]
MSENVLGLDGLVVRYGKYQALHGIDASFNGGCLGLLGANGAGKSSMLRAILGLIRPHSGKISVLGEDVAQNGVHLRSRIGYMPERDSFIGAVSGVRGIAHLAEICGIPAAEAMLRAHDVMHFVGLGEERYREVQTYSVGMRQRYKLAAALAHDPDILFLDEPTNGLDPKSRARMLGLIERITTEHDIHLVLASHLLPDVERLCDQVWVLDEGNLKQTASVSDLTAAARGAKRVRVEHSQAQLFNDAAIQQNYSVTPGKHQGEFVLSRNDELVSSSMMFELAASAQVNLLGVHPAARSLEDAFLEALEIKA